MSAATAPTTRPAFRPVDYHRLIAALTDGTFTEITRADWHSAIDRWNQLDDARRAGQLPWVKYLMVRAANDPQWQRLLQAKDSSDLRARTTPLVTDQQVGNAGVTIRNSKGYASRELAARAYARWTGEYEGAKGGWVYSTGPRQTPIIQGWWGMGTILRNQGRIVELDGRWYVAAPKAGAR